MNDFDFLVGSWNMTNRRLREPLANSDDWYEFPGSAVVSSHFGGAASFDEVHFPTLGWSGLTLRLFDPKLETWSIYWANSRLGILDDNPVVGRFEGDTGAFYCDDDYQGAPIKVRYVWTRGESPHWEQSFSPDGGQSWETNWINDFTRA